MRRSEPRPSSETKTFGGDVTPEELAEAIALRQAEQARGADLEALLEYQALEGDINLESLAQAITARYAETGQVLDREALLAEAAAVRSLSDQPDWMIARRIQLVQQSNATGVRLKDLRVVLGATSSSATTLELNILRASGLSGAVCDGDVEAAWALLDILNAASGSVQEADKDDVRLIRNRLRATIIIGSQELTTRVFVLMAESLVDEAVAIAAASAPYEKLMAAAKVASEREHDEAKASRLRAEARVEEKRWTNAYREMLLAAKPAPRLIQANRGPGWPLSFDLAYAEVIVENATKRMKAMNAFAQVANLCFRLVPHNDGVEFNRLRGLIYERRREQGRKPNAAPVAPGTDQAPDA